MGFASSRASSIPDRDADQHAEPRLLGDQRAHRASALVGVARSAAAAHLLLVGAAEPAALGERRGEHALQLRAPRAHQVLRLAQALGVAESADRGVDLRVGVGVGRARRGIIGAWP